MIISNSTWSISIQLIWIILSGDNLTKKTKKKDPFTSIHKIEANLPHQAEFEILRNGALCRANVPLLPSFRECIVSYKYDHYLFVYTFMISFYRDRKERGNTHLYHCA